MVAGRAPFYTIGTALLQFGDRRIALRRRHCLVSSEHPMTVAGVQPSMDAIYDGVQPRWPR
jgi:hypothetical protein